jgi:hypothetical protein
MQLQFNIGNRAARSIEALRVEIGAADAAETLRRAAVRTEQAGGQFLLRNADSIETEVLLR